MSKTRPTAITADKNKRMLFVAWDDGHESAYPFDGLRVVCPCVECRGGHAHMGQPPDPIDVRNAIETDLTLESVAAVGAYAVQLTWSDGHSTGIYSWDYLRSACPCPICLPE